MRSIFTISLFLLIAICAHANIWDNLFLGQGIAFNIPKNFTMTLSYDNHIKFKILGSSQSHVLSVTVQSEIIEGMLRDKLPSLPKGSLAWAKLNFGNGEMYVNSMLKDCLAVKDKALDIEFFPRIQQYTTLLTLLVSTTREGSFSKLETSKLLKLIDASMLKRVPIDKLPLDKLPNGFSMANLPDLNLILFFDTKTSDLKKIELLGPNNKTYDLMVDEFKEYKFVQDDFKIPKEWKCNNQTLKALKDLNATEIMNDIKEDRKAVLKTWIFPGITLEYVLDMLSGINSITELLDILEVLGRFF